MKQEKPQIGLVFATALLLGSLECATAQGTLVFNGTFDTDASGWTTTNISGSGGYSSAGGNPGGCFLLEGSSLNPSTISQTINGLTLGATYIVSGDYAKLKEVLQANSFGVAINGDYLFEGSAGIWQPFSFTYTATSSSAVLDLTAHLNGTVVGYVIDNIAMRAVPEPSSLCFVGMGGVAALFCLWRRVSGVRC